MTTTTYTRIMLMDNKGQWVYPDNSTGPMSTGGYPVTTDDFFRATAFPHAAAAAHYVSMGLSDARVVEVVVSLKVSDTPVASIPTCKNCGCYLEAAKGKDKAHGAKWVTTGGLILCSATDYEQAHSVAV